MMGYQREMVKDNVAHKLKILNYINNSYSTTF